MPSLKTNKKRKQKTERIELKGVSKHQNFKVVRLKRSAIKEAPYNPRIISDDAKKQLKKTLAQHGLVETLVINKRTGNLVGGHQRIKQLDDLEGNDQYFLDFAQIDVSPEKEAAINIALNNQSMFGEFDFEMLGNVRDIFPGMDLEDTGFSPMEIDLFFGDEDSPTTQGGIGITKEGDEARSELEDMKGEVKESRKEDRKKEKKRQAELDDRLKRPGYDEDERTVEFYAMIIFQTPEDKVRFNNLIQKPDYETYTQFSELKPYLKGHKEPKEDE